MISIKTMISLSAPRRTQLLVESLPLRWRNSSSYYHAVSHTGVARTTPTRASTTLILARSNARLGNKRQFSSLKNDKHVESVAPEAESLSSTASTVGPQSANSATANGAHQSFLQRFLAPKEIPPRGTLGWYREMFLICTVFAITGSSTMMLVRPAVKNVLGLQGSLREGPWSYRICSIVIMTPIYASLLVVVGTVFGRHAYFRHFSVKIFSRFGIPPELMDKSYHETKHTFRKW